MSDGLRSLFVYWKSSFKNKISQSTDLNNVDFNWNIKGNIRTAKISPKKLKWIFATDYSSYHVGQTKNFNSLDCRRSRSNPGKSKLRFMVIVTAWKLSKYGVFFWSVFPCIFLILTVSWIFLSTINVWSKLFCKLLTDSPIGLWWCKFKCYLLINFVHT